MVSLTNLIPPLLVFLAVLLAAHSQCPDDRWSSDTRNRSCYILGNASLAWTDAESYCAVTHGNAHLASIGDEREQRDFSMFLLLNQGLQGIQYIWVGLRDENGSHQSWRWSDGTPFDPQAAAKDLWLQSQPDNPMIENCGLANKLAVVQLMDYACNSSHAFVCKIYAWSPWSEWSTCTVTCGNGTRARNRSCPYENGCGNDGGSTTDTSACNTNPCPRFEQWSAWSNCNRTCGGGWRIRHRNCLYGPGCNGESAETDTCNTHRCAEWNDWGWWDSCTVDCGNGTQIRRRQCLYGTNCNGSNTQQQPCNVGPCLLETPCPPAYARHGDSCYKLLWNHTDWQNARMQCLLEYGHLANGLDNEKMCMLNQYLNGSASGEVDQVATWVWTGDEASWDAKMRSKKRALYFDQSTKIWTADWLEETTGLGALCEQRLESNGCFTDWSPLNDWCYRVLATSLKSFTDAEDYCVKSGGHLTSISDVEELHLINTLLEATPDVWIGLRELDGSWQWTDGKTVQPLFDNSSTVLQAFGSQLLGNGSSCAKVARSGNSISHLERADCNSQFGFICKVKKPKRTTTVCIDNKGPDDLLRSNESTPTLSKTDSPTCPPGWHFINGGGSICGCFMVHTVPLQYSDITRACVPVHNSQPASIRTKSENEQLLSMLYCVSDTESEVFMKTYVCCRRDTNVKTVWIGLTIPEGSTQLKWTDGTTDQESNFIISTYLPDQNRFPDQRCVFMDAIANGGGAWVVDWCYNYRPVLCRFDTACHWPTTERVYPTLGAVEKVVVTVVQTLGSGYVAAIMALTLIAFAIRKNFSVERVIMSTEEFSLMMAHLLLATAKDNYGNKTACLVVAFALHYFFTVYFAALFLEAIQAYSIITSVIPYGGFFSRRVNFMLAWGIPILIVVLTAFFCFDGYITPVMCFLNLYGSAAIPVIFTIAIITVCAMITTESAGIGEEFYPRLSNCDRTQMTTCTICQKGLLFIIPLSILGYIFMVVSVSQQNVAMFSVCSAVNIALACVIFTFHALSNPEVRLLFIKLYRKMQQKICRKKFKIEDGSFNSEYKNRDMEPF